MTENIWEKCSSCKKGIPFGAKYFLCSVSTCRQARTGVRFCTPECWDAHLGTARHREAWAEEAFAPKSATASPPASITPPKDERAPVRRIVESRPSVATAPEPSLPSNLETLVVVSKVKQLIRDKSDFSTSQCCIDALTKKVAEAALKGIEHAESMGRKTVMGRDIK